ncbi:MAG: prepilin-type N-terminal cleavage/methylation domain-containing protein [Desulfobacterales bacterium]|nr:MAG: prepilin-type N-terminal cleavage/methylation domain-containing protein [Desulfobacterales bacterium]
MKNFHLTAFKSKGSPARRGIGQGGFSLVELLVALAAASMLAGAMVGLFSLLNRSFTSQQVAADVQQVVRAAIDIMAENIRTAGIDPLKTAAAGIVVASPAHIEFKADRNMNGTIDPDPQEKEHIAFHLKNNKLMRQLNPPAGANRSMVDHVTRLRFGYFKEDGTPTNAVPDIRTVEITLTVREPAGRGNPVERTYTTRVRCRNLGI